MDKAEWDKTMKASIKPAICVCGKHYTKAMGRLGGFVNNGVTYLWACSQNCANDILQQVY